MTSERENLDDEYKRIEMRWKSDVDLKLDNLLRFAKENEQFLHLLREREESRKALRQAIIEKSLSGLVIASLAGAFAIIIDYFAKPK